MDKEVLARVLTGLPVPDFRYFKTIGSTNDEALTWAESGAADGSLVVADQQTKGRGRLGRVWVTNPGAALAFTIVVRPSTVEQSQVALFSPLAGMAICQALLDLNLPAKIKWPNDVLLARRKTCGILAESSWQGSLPQAVVIGIGINVGPSSVPPTDMVQFPATCVEQHTNQPVDRWKLLREVLTGFFTWRERLGTDEFFRTWEDKLAFRGETVYLLNSGGETITGTLLGVDAQGSLRIRQADGMEKRVSVGDVHLRPESKPGGN